MWKEADASIRAKYMAEFEVQKERYAKEIQSYRDNLTDEQKAAIRKFEKTTHEKKEKSRMKKVDIFQIFN